MIGIEEIASYIPEGRISNYDRKEQFGINDHFIEKKIGVKKVAIKAADEETSDLCFKAFGALSNKINIEKGKIDVVCVITQNPDSNIPHTSAKLHGLLDLPEKCACFDISLGCSGYVYGLSIIKSFMDENYLSNGLLFTADPYSKIVDKNDKNSSLLFGDAAAVTLMSSKPVLKLGRSLFGTIGKQYSALTCENGKLFMDGSAIFVFAAKYVPEDVTALLKINSLLLEDIDRFIFHQGSKYVVNTISSNLGLDPARVAFDIYDYGNTVSSSIPIILEKEIVKKENKRILISGFGVGLSWASGILNRL
ncbi:ketoacyl-ACP synthase III [Candidatus Saganbacteria bacterium]|nr:ketoacyl-ACP synthase III [Candidatus Saganbacteria bacterium]